MTPRTCSTCRFYFAEEGGRGECRRHPPVVFLVSTRSGPSNVSASPPVNERHYCGEHGVTVQ